MKIKVIGFGGGGGTHLMNLRVKVCSCAVKRDGALFTTFTAFVFLCSLRERLSGYKRVCCAFIVSFTLVTKIVLLIATSTTNIIL